MSKISSTARRARATCTTTKLQLTMSTRRTTICMISSKMINSSRIRIRIKTITKNNQDTIKTSSTTTRTTISLRTTHQTSKASSTVSTSSPMTVRCKIKMDKTTTPRSCKTLMSRLKSLCPTLGQTGLYSIQTHMTISRLVSQKKE